METIDGGTIRYVDLRLLPCPEDPALAGVCEGNGALEVVAEDRVVETFALTAGDRLLVADGAAVAPGTVLVARDPWEFSLRAAIPEQIDALAQWSEPLVETVDEITGLTRHGFGSGDGPVRLELRGRDGGRLAAYVIARSAHPEVASGSIVVRGQRLATIVRPDRSIRAGSDTLRALLDARPTCDRTLALVAPCDGIVEALDTTGPTMIAVRARDGRLLRLRVHGRRHVDVKVGDPVRAGEALTDGERSHHALLNAWGEERFAEHLLDELEQICGPAVPRVYWELAVRAMLGGPPAARPVLRGFGAMARELRPRRAVR